jgi:hypothetical protein
VTLPEPPVNVKLVFSNGQEVAVDTVFVGQDEDGVNVWETINVPSALQIVHVKVDKLPARTSVRISGRL